jgi:hypothetical protein
VAPNPQRLDYRYGCHAHSGETLTAARNGLIAGSWHRVPLLLQSYNGAKTFWARRSTRL